MMKLIQHLIGLTVLLANIVPCDAEESVTPPFTQPQECWIMYFDNYKSLYEDNNPEYHNLSRDLTIVRDGNDLYIQGIFNEFKDRWIKGTINGNELYIENSQPLSTANGEAFFFHWGLADLHYFNSNRFRDRIITLRTFKPTDDPYDTTTITISDDGNTITANMNPYEKSGSFWYDNKSGFSQLSFTYGWWVNDQGIEEPHGEVFPEKDYLINMCLHKIDDSGIGNMTNEDADDKSAPMYDLQGRRVDPETAGPGIYIRNRKKIML